MQSQLEAIKEFICEKTRQNGMKFGDGLPFCTDEKGKYTFREDGFWVGSFWTGINYLCYEFTGNPFFVDTARKSQHRLIRRLYENKRTLDHDLGFLYSLMFVADYQATGSENSRKIALDAAEALAERYHPNGRFIQAWNIWKPGDPFSEENRGRIIIDCMYNLPLLFWASEQSGNEQFKQIAYAHAVTCSETIVRADGSTYHSYVFDPDTGERKYGRTVQGYSDDSCWSRGQGWAIGGFAHAYRYTGDKKFLTIAEQCARYFIENLEPDYVPVWDFRVPEKQGEPRDSSAAAIAAAGMLELAKHLEGNGRDYIEAAAKIVDSLYHNYSSKDRPDDEGLLLHGCGHKPKNSEVDCSLIYGDYYFAEAVARLLGYQKFAW
jgi:unsaturated chondroitin disaccharide hydrolase